MSRVLIGGVTGATGAGLYFNGLGDTIRFVLDRGSWFGHGADSRFSTGSDVKYDELKRLVQQMSSDLGRHQQGITIVSNDRGSGRSAGLYLGAMVIGGIVYLRIFKGWKLGDMMYVTRASLDTSVGKLSDGLVTLSEKLASARSYLQAQIRALTTKQDEAMTVQSAMQEHLNVVGRDVEETRCEMAEMHGTVRELDGNMSQLSSSQQFANRGIYVLCKVVGDLIKGPSNTPGLRKSAEELQQFVLNPSTLSGRPVAGLEGLLEDRDSDMQMTNSSGPHIVGRSHLEDSHMARAATVSALPSRVSAHAPSLDRSQSSASKTTKPRHDTSRQRQHSHFDMPSTPRPRDEVTRRGRHTSSSTCSVNSAEPQRQLSAAATWASLGHIGRQ